MPTPATGNPSIRRAGGAQAVTRTLAVMLLAQAATAAGAAEPLVVADNSSPSFEPVVLTIPHTFHSGGELVRATCTCYFSSDCAGSSFCRFGAGGFTTQDICTWVDGKPNGVPGAGCDLPHAGPWGGEICDGTCVSPGGGSRIGLEPPDLIEQGVQLWADALLLPAAAGGGVPDPTLVEQVLGLGFSSPEIAINLGRQVNDLLILSGSAGFYQHFCHWEQHPDEPNPALWVDLSQDPCRADAARWAVDALLAELIVPGSGADFVDQIPKVCDDWQQLFGSPCSSGPESLACVRRRIAEAAVFLATPPSGR